MADLALEAVVDKAGGRRYKRAMLIPTKEGNLIAIVSERKSVLWLKEPRECANCHRMVAYFIVEDGSSRCPTCPENKP